MLRLQGVANGNTTVIRSLEAELTSLSDALRKVRQELSQAERGKSTIRWCNDKVSRMSIEVARQVTAELKFKNEAIQALQIQLAAAKEQGFISPTARSRPGSPRSPSSPPSPADSIHVGALQRKVAELESELSNASVKKAEMEAEIDEWTRVWQQSKQRIHELETQAAADIDTMDKFSQSLETAETDRENFEVAVQETLALMSHHATGQAASSGHGPST